jgi:hypothetical protein
VTNILLLGGGQAFFWRSLVNAREHNTSEWVAQRASAVIQQLLDDGVRVSGVALDNEAASNLLFDKLQDEFPWLLHCPCACHCLQLLVKELLALPAVAECVATLNGNMHSFINSFIHSLINHRTHTHKHATISKIRHTKSPYSPLTLPLLSLTLPLLCVCVCVHRIHR